MSKSSHFTVIVPIYIPILWIMIVCFINCGTAMDDPSKGGLLFEKKDVYKKETCDPLSNAELMERWRKLNTDEQARLFLNPNPKKVSPTSRCNTSSMANQALYRKAWFLKCSLLVYKLKSNMCPKRIRKIKKSIRKCIKRGKTLRKGKNKGDDAEVTETVMELNDDVQCSSKGSLTDMGLIRLCTECKIKRTLDASRFPRELTETSCSSSDPVCLLGDGQCIQQRSSTIVLRRTGKCTFCNGKTREEWIPETFTINTGCSCGLRPGSVFSIFV